MQNVPPGPAPAPARSAAPPQIQTRPAAPPQSAVEGSPPANSEKKGLKFPGTNCLRVCESIMWLFLILRIGVGWWLSEMPGKYGIMDKESKDFSLSLFSTIALVAFLMWLALFLPSFLYTNFRWLMGKTK